MSPLSCLTSHFYVTFAGRARFPPRIHTVRSSGISRLIATRWSRFSRPWPISTARSSPPGRPLPPSSRSPSWTRSARHPRSLRLFTPTEDRRRSWCIPSTTTRAADRFRRDASCAGLGPFWSRRDLHVWSIPKGEYADGEDPKLAAAREFLEEVGQSVSVDRAVDLG